MREDERDVQRVGERDMPVDVRMAARMGRSLYLKNMIRRGFSVKEAMSLAEIDEEQARSALEDLKAGLRAGVCGCQSVFRLYLHGVSAMLYCKRAILFFYTQGEIRYTIVVNGNFRISF